MPHLRSTLVTTLSALGLLLLPASCGDVTDATPTDTRPVERAAEPPPPIFGGTLLVMDNGRVVVAADPDRDLVHIVSLGSNEETATITLPKGALPFRVAEDAEQTVHVTLRGSGEVASIDPSTGKLLRRSAVCPNPRGIAHEPTSNMLLVACAGGPLIGLDPTDGSEVFRTFVAPDLRDVFIADTVVHVTRFRAAEVYTVDLETGEAQLAGAPGTLTRMDDQVAPGTAWRTIPRPDRGWLMLHQLSNMHPLALETPINEEGLIEETTISGVYGGSADPGVPCASVTGPAVSTRTRDGKARQIGLLANVALAVDIAVDDDGTIAVASPSRRGNEFGFDAGQSITILDMSDSSVGTTVRCVQSLDRETRPSDYVAVAFAGDGDLIAQTRRSAKLIRFDRPGGFMEIPLSGPAVADTGHDLFHIDAGLGVACATCHPEAGDDGRVWSFFELGPRRTQSLSVGLEGTEPFHWGGDMADMSHLVQVIRDGRMGGTPQSQERVDALGSWLFSVVPPNPIRAADDALAVEGAGVFVALGCQRCHSGPKLTNNEFEDLGRGPLQVPALVGVALRPPFMHDGRSADLAAATRDMVELTLPDHDLSDDEVEAVVAYMETL